MRVRTYIGLARQALRQLHRTQMVEEYEGTDHVPVCMRQDAANLEAPEAAAALIDQHDAHLPRSLRERLSPGRAVLQVARGGEYRAVAAPHR